MAHKLIIGIDYGTTFTGVSYVDSTKKSFKDIAVIRTWPGPSKEADEVWKTPSRIAYSSENKGFEFNKWGYLVTPKMKSYSWTKLLLDKSTETTRHDDPSLNSLAHSHDEGMFRLPYHKSAPEVCADFLREIYDFTMKELEKRISAERIAITPFEFWFTVPAIWSDKAKSSTKAAAEEAGFASRPGDKIFLIPEPEAAGIATLAYLTNEGHEEQLKVDDGVVICDCGGGTVDITTYKITSMNPLVFEELIVGGGGKCGSTYIDREFHRWMSKKFGLAFDELKFEKKGAGSRLMKDFESHKRDFGASRDPDQEFEVSLVMPGVGDSQYYDSDESTVKFYRDDMVRFFNPVIEKIITLLEEQIQSATRYEMGRQHKINRILLVGGFGDSPYLNERLKTWCENNGKLRLLCPEHPQAAIVKGAALRGLSGLRPTRKRCRRHYGFGCSRPFREGIDPVDSAYYCTWDGSKRCDSRVTWLIEKGQYITHEPFVREGMSWPFEASHDPVYTLDLYSCSSEKGPELRTDYGVKRIGTIVLDLKNVNFSLFESKGHGTKAKWKMIFDLQVHPDPSEGVLLCKAIIQGQEVGKTKINYVED